MTGGGGRGLKDERVKRSVPGQGRRTKQGRRKKVKIRRGRRVGGGDV